MIVLSIDLGLKCSGYIIGKVDNLKIDLLKENEIKPRVTNSLPQKLKLIYVELEKEIIIYRPEAIIVETLYSHHKHPTTLGLLSHVRGIIFLLAEQHKINVYEYSPTRARKSFLGRGNVNSDQVKKMAENVVGKKFKSVHTADAYSLISAFSHTQKVKKFLPKDPKAVNKNSEMNVLLKKIRIK